MENYELQQLLERMTVREKLGQLLQLTPEYFGHTGKVQLTGPEGLSPLADRDNGSVGSVLNCTNAADAERIQRQHLTRSRLKIPLLFMADIIHGHKTVFPIPLAMACSFEPDTVYRASRIAAVESAASGIHVTFSPMADLVRDPRWGRVMESSGEDPLLNRLFAAAAVKGYQGEGLDKEESIAACVKHFAAYGAAEGGREYDTAELTRQTLEESYLPSYKAALDAGAQMIMAAFNTIGKIPATSNVYLQQEILRNRWKFKGVVISDYNAVNELTVHGVAEDGKSAAALAANAGIDIEMMSTNYLDHGEELIRCGRLKTEWVDEAVMRILQLKNRLGLFENPFRGMSVKKEKEKHFCACHRMISRKIAVKCPVLLKNEGQVLPLNEQEKTGLAGPFAKSRHVLGAWSAGNVEGVSLYEGLCSQMKPEMLSLGACGELGSLLEGKTDIPVFSQEDLEKSFRECEKVIVAVGENQNDTGEGASKAKLRLTKRQEQLIYMLKGMGKKVIAVIFSGRPLEIAPVLDFCDAVLQAWFLGSESGNALADILLGKTGPEGKVCMSFPYTVGQAPVYYNHLCTGRPRQRMGSGRYASGYIDCPEKPLFPFGFGLTYGRSRIQSIEIRKDSFLRLDVIVRNEGEYACRETIQLYSRQHRALIARPVRELKDFCHVEFLPGEEKKIVFQIRTEMLCYPYEGEEKFEPGMFTFMAGLDSEHVFQKTIHISLEDYNWMKRKENEENT